MAKDNQERQTPKLKLRDFTPKGFINYMDKTWNATENNVAYNLGLMTIAYTYAISAGLTAAGLEQILK
jgi:hypothetical protein